MVTLKSLENGFRYVDIKNSNAHVKIALQGAHIFEYKRQGEKPLLWLSPLSDFEEGRAIRGGVPLCWPAFGTNNPQLKQHGFARVSMFEFMGAKEINEGLTEVLFELRDTKESLNIWNHKFKLEFKVTLSKSLEMQLKTTNLDDKEFLITEALHTYFNISDISNAKVKGLDSKAHFDALSNENSLYEGEITFKEEFDSVFQGVENDLYLEDNERTIQIKNEGSLSVIVWNPWIEKCSKMSAMKDDAYREFVCIESANAYEDFRVLKVGESHTLKATLE